MKRIKEEALRIGTLQYRCGVQMPAEDYVEQYRFGLTQVVYEWANGMVSGIRPVVNPSCQSYVMELPICLRIRSS